MHSPGVKRLEAEPDRNAIVEFPTRKIGFYARVTYFF